MYYGTKQIVRERTDEKKKTQYFRTYRETSDASRTLNKQDILLTSPLGEGSGVRLTAKNYTGILSTQTPSTARRHDGRHDAHRHQSEDR